MKDFRIVTDLFLFDAVGPKLLCLGAFVLISVIIALVLAGKSLSERKRRENRNDEN